MTSALGRGTCHCPHILPQILWGRSCPAGMGTGGEKLQWRVVSSVLRWSSTLEPTGLLEGVSSSELLQLQLLELLELALDTVVLVPDRTRAQQPLGIVAALVHNDIEKSMDQRFSKYVKENLQYWCQDFDHRCRGHAGCCSVDSLTRHLWSRHTPSFWCSQGHLWSSR